jgi:hypothetical protein
MRTGLILDWGRTRQQVVQQKFALRVKARFNPFRDWAGCTIAMRWQRRLQGNSFEDKTLLGVTRQRRSSRFLRASFPRSTISLRSPTEEPPPSREKSFSCRSKRSGEATTVESYPEDVKGRSVSAPFLHNGTVSMFLREGFKRFRRIGKNHWVVTKVVRKSSRKV